MKTASVAIAFPLAICLAVAVAACGGGGGDGGITSPTAQVATPEETAEAERTPQVTATAISPKETYRAQMSEFIPEIEQIFGVEWPEAIATEPMFGEDWQKAVSTLAGKAEALGTRIEAVEPPEELAVTHQLFVDSINTMAEAARKVRVAGPIGDTEGLQEGLTDTQVALQLLEEAAKEFQAAR